LDVETPQFSLNTKLLDTVTTDLIDIPQTVNFDQTLLTYVTSVAPRWGSVEGSTNIVINVDNLGTTDPADVQVFIDRVVCDISSVTLTTIDCTSRPRPGLYESEPTLDIYVNGRGKIDTLGKNFRSKPVVLSFNLGRRLRSR